jgi:ABC-2 type transport system permease protein
MDIPVSETRPLYWSVRRELWENRSVYVAPLAVASVVMFGFLISVFTLPHRLRDLPVLNAKGHDMMVMPYSVAAGLTVVIAFIVGGFYCLDALHGERRDRSILFWKSLPVSDLTTVLAKASIPLVILPVLSFEIIVTAQFIMLLLSTIVLLASDASVAALWDRLPLIQMTVALMYSLIAIALWHAPIYGWLLLVSAWARRATFLWAVVPFTTIGVFERMAFGSSRIGLLIQYRLIGWYTESFDFKAPGHDLRNPLTSLTPGKFLSTPGLWIGLVIAALFIAAAVRLRRDREPI